MKSFPTLSRVVPIVVFAILTTAFVWFVSNKPVDNLEARVPGMDARPKLLGIMN